MVVKHAVGTLTRGFQRNVFMEKLRFGEVLHLYYLWYNLSLNYHNEIPCIEFNYVLNPSNTQFILLQHKQRAFINLNGHFGKQGRPR